MESVLSKSNNNYSNERRRMMNQYIDEDIKRIWRDIDEDIKRICRAQAERNPGPENLRN